MRIHPANSRFIFSSLWKGLRRRGSSDHHSKHGRRLVSPQISRWSCWITEGAERKMVKQQLLIPAKMGLLGDFFSRLLKQILGIDLFGSLVVPMALSDKTVVPKTHPKTHRSYFNFFNRWSWWIRKVSRGALWICASNASTRLSGQETSTWFVPVTYIILV